LPGDVSRVSRYMATSPEYPAAKDQRMLLCPCFPLPTGNIGQCVPA
jgi:hypothetical protein